MITLTTQKREKHFPINSFINKVSFDWHQSHFFKYAKATNKEVIKSRNRALATEVQGGEFPGSWLQSWPRKSGAYFQGVDNNVFWGESARETNI